MEMLYGARTAEDRDRLRAFEWPAVTDEVCRPAVDVQCELIAKGNHRALSLPDLMVAATEERHQATVRHYGGGYVMIAAVTCLATKWVAPAGGAD